MVCSHWSYNLKLQYFCSQTCCQDFSLLFSQEFHQFIHRSKYTFLFVFNSKTKEIWEITFLAEQWKAKGKPREKFATILSSTWNWASHACSGPILLLFEQAKCNNICYIISTLKALEEGKSCAGIIDFLITFPWPEITKFSQCYFLVIFGKFYCGSWPFIFYNRPIFVAAFFGIVPFFDSVTK